MEPLAEPELLKRMQQFPWSWIEIVFNERLNSYQKNIAESVRDNRYTSVKSCNTIGKSHIVARIALWFLYTHPFSKVITTAPTFRQVEDVIWREIRNAFSKATIKLEGVLNQTELDLGTEWFATGVSTNDKQRISGFHAEDILFIVDEAAGVDEDIFNSAEGIVNTQGARVVYIGNPDSTAGTFYNSFRLPTYNKISVSAFDTPNFTAFGITLDDIRSGEWKNKINAPLPAPYLITPEWVADKLVKWGEGSPYWDSRVMGNFPTQGESTLIPLHKIEAAVNREMAVKNTDPEAIGVDVAGFGTNKTVFVYRKGPKVVDIQTFSHMESVETGARLFDFTGFHPVGPIYIDFVGIGFGASSEIKRLFNDRRPGQIGRIKDVNVGLPANDKERFINLRAEIYWNLRERFINDDISIPNDEDLKSQLAAIEFEYTPKGQIKIESKEDMQKRGIDSPDKADALAMAFGNIEPEPGLIGFLRSQK